MATTEMDFDDVVSIIEGVGIEWHRETILKNTRRNAKFVSLTIGDLDCATSEGKKIVVVSAGPSLHDGNNLEILSEHPREDVIIVAIDGSYIKCLKNNIFPNYLLTLDPHPTRLVRWFGDPDFLANTKNDDYFNRQDLDKDFRQNSIEQNEQNIKLVNEHAHLTKLIIASTAPVNVVSRTEEAGFDRYWWIPLVDNPDNPSGITAEMMKAMPNVPSFNTGGNVGTAAWVFSQFVLDPLKVAVLGMDLSYPNDMPVNMTQTFPELETLVGENNLKDTFFKKINSPFDSGTCYTDPTYFWYRNNILDMLRNNSATLYNCSGAGILFGDGVKIETLSNFLGAE